MASFMEVTYSYIYSLCHYFRFTWPLSLIYGQRLQPPSHRTKEAVLKAINLMKMGDCSSREILELLASLPPKEDVLRVVDKERGFDVMQHAVITDYKDVVSLLLSQGCCPDRYHCSNPIHLAAYLGRSAILKILLESGADPSVRTGMCFPEPHLPVRCHASYFGFSQYPVYLCRTQHTTPMQCAIRQSNLECVKILTQALQHNKHTASLFNPLLCLQQACRQGSPECIHYFVTTFPECINQYGPDGDTPLLTAVSWGEERAKILVDNGADVHQVSRNIHETALHRLYRMNIDGLFSIYDTTCYLLMTGIEQDINAVTDLGETPLHMLVSHVSYTGGNYMDPRFKHISRQALQPDYQRQVLMALKAILQFNADPLMLNDQGLQPLSRMLHIALKSCHRSDPCPCVSTSQPDIFIVEYQNDYATLAEAMEILLDHGAPSNFKCGVGHTPLILLMQCFLHDDFRSLTLQAKDALAAVETLIKHGANVNFTDVSQGTAATLIAMICCRCLTDSLAQHDKQLQVCFAAFTDDLLRLLLSHGLDPNYSTSRTSPFLRGGKGNSLIEFVRLANVAKEAEDFGFIHRWLKTLLQWGADPDMEPYQSEPVICHSQSSIFLKKQGTQPVSHYLHEARERQNLASADISGGMCALLELFYNSMDHKVLYSCLHVFQGISRFHLHDLAIAGNNQQDDFLSTVQQMAELPRSLKQISRVAVYKALGRRIADKVDKLPIPWAVKQYLLEVL